YGSHCAIRGKLEQANPATNPFEFNYKQYLFEQGMTKQLIIDSLKHIQCKENKTFLSGIHSLRDYFIYKANEKLSPELAAWQQALIFGNSDELREEIILLFQR